MIHEPQNLAGHRIAAAGAVMALAAAGVLGICYLLWTDWAASALPTAHLPPEPQLQPTPGRDLAAYRRGTAGRNDWQWVDVEHRTARVPVDRAMRIMVKEPTP